MAEKTYTKADIIDIIQGEVQDLERKKNEYIRKHGFRHAAALKSFDSAIASLIYLYCKF